MQPAPPLPMFFFGTLMDQDVLAAVLNRPVGPGSMQPARLNGWRRVALPERTYPMLIPHPTGVVNGLLAMGLDQRDRDRLDHYEGPEYRVGLLTVRLGDGSGVEAETYLCSPDIPPGDVEWHLDTWRRRYKRTALPRIRALMAGYRD